MFDELAGVGPIKRRKFYKDLVDTLKWEFRRGTDEDLRAMRKRILSNRYEPQPAALSPLIWSDKYHRSFAQAVFVAPLRGHAKSD